MFTDLFHLICSLDHDYREEAGERAHSYEGRRLSPNSRDKSLSVHQACLPFSTASPDDFFHVAEHLSHLGLEPSQSHSEGAPTTINLLPMAPGAVSRSAF